MTPGLAPWWQGMDARHKAGHDEQEIRRLTAFRFVTIFLQAFPAEGRIHEASLVRGKVRRLLPRFATRHRDGTGPRLRLLRTGARSSLTERPCALHVLTKSAARAEKSPCWSAAKRPPLAREATNGRPDAPSALRPPRFLRGLTNASDAQRARARG